MRLTNIDAALPVHAIAAIAAICVCRLCCGGCRQETMLNQGPGSQHLLIYRYADVMLP